MKVKELIEKLKQLDPEKNIWVFYDYPYSCCEPEFDKVTREEADNFFDKGCVEGDYAHYAG